MKAINVSIAAAIVIGAPLSAVIVANNATASVPTYADYVAAAQKAVACIERHGANSSFVETDQHTINIFIGSDGTLADDELSTIYDDCTNQYLDDTQTAYLASIRPTEAESDALLQQCIVDLGLLGSGATADDVDRLLRDHLKDGDPAAPGLAACVRQAHVARP